MFDGDDLVELTAVELGEGRQALLFVVLPLGGRAEADLRGVRGEVGGGEQPRVVVAFYRCGGAGDADPVPVSYTTLKLTARELV